MDQLQPLCNTDFTRLYITISFPLLENALTSVIGFNRLKDGIENYAYLKKYLSNKYSALDLSTSSIDRRIQNMLATPGVRLLGFELEYIDADGCISHVEHGKCMDYVGKLNLPMIKNGLNPHLNIQLPSL